MDSMSVHARIPRGKIFRPVMFPKKEQAQAGLVARLGLGFVGECEGLFLGGFFGLLRYRLSILEDGGCTQYGRIILVEELDVVVHLEGVVDDVAIDSALKERTALAQHEVAAAQRMLLTEACELLQQTLTAQVLLHQGRCGVA